MGSIAQRVSIISINQHLQTIDERLNAIDGKTWATSRKAVFDTVSSDTLISFEEKLILNCTLTLKDIIDGYKGMQPYEEGKGTPAQTREMMNAKVYHSDNKIDDTYYPLIGSGHVQRYYLRDSTEFIKYGRNLASPRKFEIFSSPRLLVNRILSKSTVDVTYAEDVIINNTDVFNLIAKEGHDELLKPILGILASKLCATYFRKSNVNLSREAFPKLNVNNILDFPFPDSIDLKQKQSLTQLVEQMMTNAHEFQKFQLSTVELLKVKYDIEKPSRNLQNWPNLDFKGFLAELKKAKVVMGLSEEAEWMAYFNAQKQKANALQAEIDRIDKEIDAMVYQLYGLTPEEIAIVENA